MEKSYQSKGLNNGTVHVIYGIVFPHDIYSCYSLCDHILERHSKMKTWDYKGFVINYRKKPLTSSSKDYDWFDGKLWHYAPSWEAAMTDIDLFLISTVFDTTGM